VRGSWALAWPGESATKPESARAQNMRRIRAMSQGERKSEWSVARGTPDEGRLRYQLRVPRHGCHSGITRNRRESTGGGINARRRDMSTASWSSRICST
jgi:hypothetical protein